MHRGLIRALIALLLLVAAAAGGIATAGLTARPASTDCVVVPGNTVDPDGSLSPRLRARLDEALRLYRRGLSSRIFVSGGLGREGHYEGTAMRRYLQRQGVPAAAIFTDDAGYNTEATARNYAHLARTQGWQSAVVVSQYFHVSRTRLLLRQQGIRRVSASAAPYWELRDAYALLREVPALALAWLH